MVCLGFEPGAADWKAETNPLSYGGTPTHLHSVICTNQRTLNIGGSITERLTSCLTGLASAALLMLNYIEINKFGRIQTIQAGGQPHSDTSIYKVNECSLNCLTHM